MTIPYKHSPFDESILDAMFAYNQLNFGQEKFSLVDARIISLIHSYHYNNKQFFGSNTYLAYKCMTTEPTVQKSINKLCALNFIAKKVSCQEGRKRRVLSYNEDAIEDFKKNMSAVEINDP